MPGCWTVALRKESVDRNIGVGTTRASLGVSLSARRAWIEIQDGSRRLTRLIPSLSARRAWIEIRSLCQSPQATSSLSARRAWIEILAIRSCGSLPASLSARRAWIEIAQLPGPVARVCVALRKESVDRNQEKSVAQKAFDASLSARRAWIEISASGPRAPVSECRSPQGERG